MEIYTALIYVLAVVVYLVYAVARSRRIGYAAVAFSTLALCAVLLDEGLSDNEMMILIIGGVTLILLSALSFMAPVERRP